MKTKHYTLVEIMMVVGIIAILVGLAIPVLNSARATAKLNKASAECNAIALAIKNFEAEYGQMPNPEGTGAITSQTAPYEVNVSYTTGIPSGNTKYKPFFTMLIGYAPGSLTKLTSSSNDWNNNKKHITFLDPPGDYTKDANSTFFDPWGKPYGILYKVNGEIDNSFNLYGNTNQSVSILNPVAVYTVEGTQRKKVSDEHYKNYRFATSWRGVYTTNE